MEPSRRRPLRDVLGTGALTGLVAGAAAGAIDAVWSWRAAAQFVPHAAARLRFVAYAALAHAAAGLVVGVVAAAIALVLARGSRLGDLVRFAFADHATRRAADPRVTVVGLSVVLAGVPTVAAALWLAYRATVPFVTGRHVVWAGVAVAMTATVVAIAIAIPIAFVVARAIEIPLAALATRLRAVSSVWAPFVALGVLVAAGLGLWAAHDRETARLLALRGPLVLALGALLALPASASARRAVAALARARPWPRRAAWIGVPVAVVVAMLASGRSAQVQKAAAAYTGLGAPIARTLRRAVDFDRDGYSPILGGGDCDDFDPTVHPGAPEIPDDGVDQNCIGGDAHVVPRTIADVGFAPVPAALPKDFDVLLVTIDTTRADHLGMYGYPRPTSPNLDRLAADGTLFVNGWAHAPSTRYSMPAILTGRLPLDVYYDTSLEGWPGLDARRATTIAQRLKPLGFATGAITNYWYFDRSRHMDQGFDEYDNENARLHSGVPGAGPEQTRGSSSKEQTDKALAFVAKHAGERWFLWVHYYDPHYAYEPHAEVPSFGTDREALYDGELRFTDLHVGRLLDDLRARGLYDKTVVVVTGDHGEGFGEHGVELHGYHLYAAQTKVPMLVRVPGVAPRRATTPAGHVDLVPTLVNLAGGTASTDMMGRSLVDVISGGAAADRDRVVFQQLSYEGNHELRAGVGRDCHVLYNVSPDTSWEVYRVDRDPLEAEDLADDDDACADTRRAVEHWYDASTVPAGAADALLAARPPIATPLDADLGTSVRLLAVDAPKAAHPGEPIEVTWTFEARGRVAAGWKLFVHVVGPGKQFLANADHAPARPFEWWKPGDLVRYKSTIVVPRAGPGRYTLWVGMFRGDDRAKASAPRATVDNNAVEVATIEVAP